MKKIPNMKYVPNCCYYSLKLELFDYNRYFSDFSEAWNYQKNKKISDIQKNPKIQNFRNWFFQLSECGIFSFWQMTSISPYFSKSNNFQKYIIADIKNLQNCIIRLYKDGISSFWVMSSRSLWKALNLQNEALMIYNLRNFEIPLFDDLKMVSLHFAQCRPDRSNKPKTAKMKDT